MLAEKNKPATGFKRRIVMRRAILLPVFSICGQPVNGSGSNYSTFTTG
jgi:hypothetical protein